MANELERWFKEIPPVTRFLFAGSLLITLAANFGILSPMSLVFIAERIYRNFEIWRLVTPFLYHGKLGFPFLVNMMFLYRYGALLENEIFRSTADFVFMLLFGGLALIVMAFVMDFYVLGMSLILMIIYYWSKKMPDIPMSFMFGIKFVSAYFPWVLIGFRVLMGGTPIPELVGVAVGHLYFFLIDYWPQNGGPRILNTPQFLKNLFHEEPVQRPGEGPRQPGYNWGRGQNLN